MASQPFPRLTPTQYLKIEREAEFRSEYLDGQVCAMAASTINHVRIVGNALRVLSDQLSVGGCEAFSTDLRLWSDQHRVYTYPDVLVACAPLRFQDERRDTITDATLVVEVLSPSTMNYDRGEKFRFYRSLPSFSEYLLFAQDTIRAEHHIRQSDGGWLFHESTAPEALLELPSINCRFVLGDLYQRVQFDA